MGVKEEEFSSPSAIASAVAGHAATPSPNPAILKELTANAQEGSFCGDASLPNEKLKTLPSAKPSMSRKRACGRAGPVSALDGTRITYQGRGLATAPATG
jgi:hypothetical protein